MARPIEHSGVVERTAPDAVYVRITSRSACGACRARQACGLAETQEKIVAVKTADAPHYAAGEQVVVGVRRSAGMRAVALAYVAALGGVGLYYVVLWLCRRRIEHTIHFTITKI